MSRYPTTPFERAVDRAIAAENARHLAARKGAVRLDADEPRVEPCAFCGTPATQQREVQAEPVGGLGFVRSFVFLCGRHYPDA